MGYLGRISECNDHDLTSFLPLRAQGRPLGYVHRELEAALLASSSIWERTGSAVTIREGPGNQFKFNCNLVILDFLVRHGILDPREPDYFATVSGLRQLPRLFSPG